MKNMSEIIFSNLETIKTDILNYLNNETNQKKNSRQKESESVFKADIGGKIFEIEIEKILEYPKSLLGVIILSKKWNPEKNIYFFDKNRTHFNWVYKLLRKKKINISQLENFELSEVIKMLQYFDLPFEKDFEKDCMY